MGLGLYLAACHLVMYTFRDILFVSWGLIEIVVVVYENTGFRTPAFIRNPAFIGSFTVC